MNRKMFSLRSVLPPAELKVKLDREVRVHNSLQKSRCKLALKWKDGDRFTLCLLEYKDGSGPYHAVEIGRRSVSISAGYGLRRSVSYSPVFCGQLAPNGEGSVIFGYFRQVYAVWLIFVTVILGGFVAFAVTRQPLGCLITAVIGGPLFCALLRPERTESSGDLWDALEFLVATVDSLADGQEATKKHIQN